jgi:hypothetical protein
MFEKIEVIKKLLQRVEELEVQLAASQLVAESNSSAWARIEGNIESTIAVAVAAAVESRIRTIEDERQARAESTTPYFEILSEIETGVDGKTKLEMDWNSAFIEELRRKGYVGENEQSIVQQWMLKLAAQLDGGDDE